MDSIQKMLSTPAWAYSACYVYPIVAFFTILFGIIGLISLLMLPASTKQMIPMGIMITGSILQLLVIAFYALMSFWICRGALSPTKEKFATATTTTNNNPAEAPVIGQHPAVAEFDPEGYTF